MASWLDPTSDYAKSVASYSKSEAEKIQDWIDQGLLPTAPKVPNYKPQQYISNPEAYGLEKPYFIPATGTADYMDWLEKSKGGVRFEEPSKFAKEIPTVTQAKFNDTTSLIDSITNAGYAIINQENIKSTKYNKDDRYTVARYDPVTGEYTDPTQFYVSKIASPDGISIYTGQAFDARMGQGRVGTLEGMPTEPGGVITPPSNIPGMPTIATRSAYRALTTPQRLALKAQVEANGIDWQEWLSGLKDPAPKVVSYDELRMMSAQDKSVLRQQVEDAGLSWSDYVDQIYEPWRASQESLKAMSSFATPRRVSYAIPRG